MSDERQYHPSKFSRFVTREQYNQLKKSFDVLTREHQALIGRFSSLRRAAAPIVSTYQAYEEYAYWQVEHGNPPDGFAEWASHKFDDDSLREGLERLSDAHKLPGDNPA